MKSGIHNAPAETPRGSHLGADHDASGKRIAHLTESPTSSGNLFRHLTIKVLTVDADFRQIEPNPQGLSHTLENLPTDKTVEAYLMAANEAGESDPSATVG